MNENWEYVTFDKLFAWNEKSHIKSGDGLKEGAFDFFVCSDTEVKKYNTSLFTGEALIFGTGGKPSLHYKNGSFAYSTDCVVATKIMEDLNLKFFYYFLRQGCMKQLQEGFKGSGLQHISKKYIEKILIPKINLEEQNRIVSRIEELLSELDAGIKALEVTKEKLEVYRQAVLKKAFASFSEKKLFGAIADTRLGKMLDKNKNEGTPRKYLRNVNVRWFDFDLSDLQEMKIKDDEIEKYSIKKGDLVICEGGEPGRCAVWNQDESIFFQKALHRIRFKQKANPIFYMYYLWLYSVSGELNKYFTGTGIKHLTGESLSKVSVPFCSFAEQNQIVSEIESRLSVCDEIEKTVNQTLKQAEMMRQSILKKAFEGGL